MAETFATGGTLYVVATPLGHPLDITLRALAILKSVEWIAAEDTRVIGQLLAYHQIKSARLISCHEYNEQERTAQLIEWLRAGKSGALVSDAGTPLISDPGFRLITQAIAAGLSVLPLPGPCAMVAAMSVAGFPTDTFTFIGFPPKKAGRRQDLLQSLKPLPHPMIFYESPRRLVTILKDILTHMGDRPALLAREMTKPYEEYLRGPVCDLLNQLQARAVIKGECTIVIAGCPAGDNDSPAQLETELASRLAAGERLSDLSRELARRYALPRRQIYEIGLEMPKARQAPDGDAP